MNVALICGPGVHGPCFKRPGHGGSCEDRATVEAGVRETWPGARWMPWDDPPIGQRVCGGTGGGILAVVVGQHLLPTPRAHDCPDCKHDGRPSGLAGWWEVRLLRSDGTDWLDEGGKPIIVALEYPPSLREAP